MRKTEPMSCPMATRKQCRRWGGHRPVHLAIASRTAMTKVIHLPQVHILNPDGTQTLWETRNKISKAREGQLARLRREFLEYAGHKADCAGGDGTRCACGYLDIYSRLTARS